MKKGLMLLTILIAAALTQLYRAHVELRYDYETLAWQVKCGNDQLQAIIATDFQRQGRDARKIAELEAKLKLSAAEKDRTN
jgi:hypothetical protein